MASNDVQDQDNTALASETLLQDLAEKIVEWRFLGRRLGLDEGQLDNIERDNRGESKEIKYKTLLHWKRQSVQPPATIGCLAKALTEVGRADLAVFVVQESKKPIPQVIPRKIPLATKRNHASITKKANMTGRHNMVLGDNSAEDFVLYTERCREDYVLIPQRKEHIFQYHKKPNETITGVLVYDNWDDDTGGTAHRIAGGPGENCIKVKVTSQILRGMDFTFFVYGHKC
ncbi:hypothetical protein BSL78_21956 [Apostichopus japonicus]|uniref:Death domain-containing protein n=1 Tax=Stichopus japonicus TaxID=307972 RepID=A0A2G8JZM7_STIJA|nr:hypothetical protein BSL78_21956 [Apostichopus japonicus]